MSDGTNPEVWASRTASEQGRLEMRRATCVAFAICLSTFAMAGPQEDGQAVFNKFLDDFTAANPDVMAAHFAPDALFWGTASRDLISGTSSIRQYFSDAFKRLP